MPDQDTPHVPQSSPNDHKPAVLQLHRDGPWHTAEQLAERLGISTRTLYRRVDNGAVEKTYTHAGVRFRVAFYATPKGDVATLASSVEPPNGKALPAPTVAKHGKTLPHDTVAKSPFEVCQKPVSTDGKRPLARDGKAVSRQPLPTAHDKGLPSSGKALTGHGKVSPPSQKEPAQTSVATNQHTMVEEGQSPVVELAVRLAASEHARGRVEVELEQVKVDHAKLWEIVGELTGEMIELERRLAISEGGRC